MFLPEMTHDDMSALHVSSGTVDIVGFRVSGHGKGERLICSRRTVSAIALLNGEHGRQLSRG